MGQSDTCPHSELKLHYKRMLRSIRHPQPRAILHLAKKKKKKPQMTDSCMTIRMLTVQKRNSVIICGPDLEPNSTHLVLSSANPLSETELSH